MQSAYIGKLMELAEQDARVIHVLADSGTGYDEMFRKNFPKQIYNFGISEENMVAAAAGMASAGKIPFVFTAGAFLAYRSLEFIRDDLCFQNLNVKIVGMGSGLSWSTLGPTHHTTEDIAVLRAIPNLTILSPATPKQVSECVELAYKTEGPCYIRIGMNHEKEFFEEAYNLQLGKNDVLRNGSDAVIFSTGSILENVCNAADMLKDCGYSVSVVNVSTIKPIDTAELSKQILSAKKVFSVEEHSVHGGLGSILAETVAFNGLNKQVFPIGLEDVFAKGYGTYATVRKENGLDADGICKKILAVLKNE